MKRTILAGMAVLGSVLAAQADTSIYHNTRKQPRSDAELQVDTQYCTQRVGPDRNGVPTSASFKRCMASRGWRFDHTNVEHTWIDPDTGLTCRNSTFFGIPASECSNF